MSNQKYTYEEITSALKEVSKVMDINKVRTLAVLNEILPNYDAKMADWRIGEFLRNARNGGYLSYRNFLTEIGYKFHTESIIARINRICEAIDTLVANNIDLNTIPSDAMMSDYVPTYKDNDLPIGSTLTNAKYGRVGRVVEAKLKEHNFSFVTKLRVKENDIDNLLKDVAKVTDLNTIPNKATVRDYLPDYASNLIDFKIGILIQNARAGGYKPHHELLKHLGFNFNNIRTRHSFDFICNAIDELIKKGININEIPTNALMSQYIPKYIEDDLKIGQIFHYARIGKCGQVIKRKLEEHGFKFTINNSKKEELRWIIQEIGRVYDINKVNDRMVVEDILPEYSGRYKEFQIGKFLTQNRHNPNKDYVEVLNRVGFDWDIRRRMHSTEYICEAIRNLVNKGIDLNEIPLRARMCDYIPTYIKSDDFGIGSLLNRARMGLISEDIREELKKYNFKFNLKTKYATVEYKIKVLKRIIDTGVDINTIKDRATLKDFIELSEGEFDYPVGKWLSRARNAIGGEDFLIALQDIGYKSVKFPKTL